jgi:hypothetical protein
LALNTNGGQIPGVLGFSLATLKISTFPLRFPAHTKWGPG